MSILLTMKIPGAKEAIGFCAGVAKLKDLKGRMAEREEDNPGESEKYSPPGRQRSGPLLQLRQSPPGAGGN
jgi:hypothetical protein